VLKREKSKLSTDPLAKVPGATVLAQGQSQSFPHQPHLLGDRRADRTVGEVLLHDLSLVRRNGVVEVAGG